MREFYIAFGITSVSIPASVEVIKDTLRASRLHTIVVATDNEHFSSQDGILFNKDMTELIRSPRMHGFNEQYVVPESVKTIHGNAFYDSEYLADVRLSPNMTRLEGGFIWCDRLTSVYVPRSITYIGRDSFGFGRYPTRDGYTIFYEGSKEEWDAITISGPSGTHDLTKAADRYHDAAQGGLCKDGLLYYIDHDGVLRLVTDEKAKTVPAIMGDYGDSAPPWKKHEGLVRSLEVSEKITNIGAHAFKGCSQMERATIPYSVSTVAPAAFAQCPKLTVVTCTGNGFAVQSADSAEPSFDAATVQLHYMKGKAGWTDAPSYDASAGTWNGYILIEDATAALPVPDSVSFIWKDSAVSSVKVVGLRQYVTFESVGLSVTSLDGEEMADKVDVAIESSPARTTPLASGMPLGNYEYAREQFDVAYNPRTSMIEVGNCALAGEYKIRVTPKEHVASGDSVYAVLNVERYAEKLYGGVGGGERVLRGRYSSSETTTVQFRPWSQYGEVVEGSLSFDIFDVLSDSDLTGDLEAHGFLGFDAERASMTVSEFANPRSYRITLKDVSGRYSGSVTIPLNLKRVQGVLNKPYALSLSGGSGEISVSSDGTWASTPYRVRVLDGYDDPCWPDLSWKIADETGSDVTQCFEVDAQGYVYARPEAVGLLEGGDRDLAIISAADGVDGTDDDAAIKARESNQLAIRLKKEPPPSAPITHIATFKVGDEVIGQVTFAEGDAMLEEPAMPPKANYIGSWEIGGTPWRDFDLSSVKSDIEINGVYSPIDPDAVSEVEVSGNAEYEDGAVTVSLQASAASRNVRVESSATKPVDVVLVCDQSGSMASQLGGKGGLSKRQALIDCARSFADKLYENAKKTGADHRVGLVGFAYSDDRDGRSVNTGLLATKAGAGIRKFSSLKSSDYANALLPINTGNSMNPTVTAGIASIKAEGATAANLGLEMAKSIFSMNPVGDGTSAGERERIVLFITDGTPTSWGTSSSESGKVSNTAAAALKQANYIKQSQGARIYSIGVEAAANAAAGSLYGDKGWKVEKNETKFDFNRFLHLVSSNYPAATSMSSRGPGSQDGGYYMPVTNTDSLDGIFTNILYSTVYSVEAFDRATLRYEVPSSLTLTLKQEEEMRADLMGQGISAEDISVLREGDRTILVFSNVPVKLIRNDGIPSYVAQVRFRLSVAPSASGSVSMGNAEADCMGEIISGSVSEVVVPSGRCVVVFNIDGQPYEIRDMQIGDSIAAPDTNLARWMDLEKLQDPKVTGSLAVFETSTLTRAYALNWIVSGASIKVNLAPGESVEVPDEAIAKIPDGYELAGWMPAPPLSMPSQDVTCVAVLTERHVHTYAASSYKTGDCTVGMTVHDVCTCGEEEVTQEMPRRAHVLSTVLSNEGGYTDATKGKLACAECGYSIDKDMKYEAAYGSDEVAVLDLTKLESDVAKPGASADDIELQYFMDASDGDEYVVTRIDEDDSRTEYASWVRDGYLWFKPDHFSIYVIGKKDASGDSTSDGVMYEDSLERLERASAERPVPGDGPDDGHDDDFEGNGNGSGGVSGTGDGSDDAGGAGNGSTGSGGSVNGETPGASDGSSHDRSDRNDAVMRGDLAKTGDVASAWAAGFGMLGIAAACGVFGAHRLRRRYRAERGRRRA